MITEYFIYWQSENLTIDCSEAYDDKDSAEEDLYAAIFTASSFGRKEKYWLVEWTR